MPLANSTIQQTLIIPVYVGIHISGSIQRGQSCSKYENIPLPRYVELFHHAEQHKI